MFLEIPIQVTMVLKVMAMMTIWRLGLTMMAHADHGHAMDDGSCPTWLISTMREMMNTRAVIGPNPQASGSRDVTSHAMSKNIARTQHMHKPLQKIPVAR
jgi:hypothetical protein